MSTPRATCLAAICLPVQHWGSHGELWHGGKNMPNRMHLPMTCTAAVPVPRQGWLHGVPQGEQRAP